MVHEVFSLTNCLWLEMIHDENGEIEVRCRQRVLPKWDLDSCKELCLCAYLNLSIHHINSLHGVRMPKINLVSTWERILCINPAFIHTDSFHETVLPAYDIRWFHNN